MDDLSRWISAGLSTNDVGQAVDKLRAHCCRPAGTGPAARWSNFVQGLVGAIFPRLVHDCGGPACG